MKDKLAWNDEAEKYLISEVLKEGSQQFFLNKIKKVL